MLTCLFLLLQVPIELEGIVGVNRTASQEIPGFFHLFFLSNVGSTVPLPRSF